MNKQNLKLVIFPIIVVLLLGTIYAVIFSRWKDKTPATYEQVWSILENNGYVPTDMMIDDCPLEMIYDSLFGSRAVSIGRSQIETARRRRRRAAISRA